MELVQPKPAEKQENKKRKTARKVVGFAEALLSTLRDPEVQKGAQDLLDQQKKRAAERSFAGQANQVFGVATDPRVLAIAELLVAVVRKQVVKRKR